MTDQREANGAPEQPIGDVDAGGVPIGHEAERRPAEDDTAAHDDGTDMDTDDLTVQGGE
ncbi:hypothetical protein [Sphingomonas sp. Mn802worker]|uniref:hypothetical protein n=1 Tax=Sphingomonas sp. Mn802worker TaxID=629773 RepID=UPI000376F1C9|nr:hypothetical protein [Sphingomonas sp. Mn802worker]